LHFGHQGKVDLSPPNGGGKYSPDAGCVWGIFIIRLVNDLVDAVKGEFLMLWTIAVVLVVLWLLGLLGHVGGSLVHLLLVVAVIIIVVNLLGG
jgi:hypothetical protein